MMKCNYERQAENRTVYEAITELDQPTSKDIRYECHLSEKQTKTILSRLKAQDKIEAKPHPEDGRKVVYANKV